MITIPRPNTPAGESVPAKRSVLGLLFNPRLGSSISPLRESAQIFLQLLATVFALYKLLPKDYPGLRDTSARLSFFAIIRSAWQNVRFMREGAPQAVLFFGVLGLMAAGTFIVLSTLFGLFVGHAHAQSASAFQPADQDVAQAWINYLFNNKVMPDYYANMGKAIPQNMGLQAALTSALAFYADAILIVAALILFYHLTAMVVETAHHGVPMGKRASQIWAPIRLVVAIGLLIPINGGLSSGQYIVVKVASLGSGLASQTWGVFLNALNGYAPKAVPPNSPIVTQIAGDLIVSEACMYDYNQRVAALASYTPGLKNAKMAIYSTTQTIDGRQGTKYSFTTHELMGQDMCGWYFIPTPPASTSDPASAVAIAAYAAEAKALNDNLKNFEKDGELISLVMPESAGGLAGTAPLTLDPQSLNDVIAYQSAVANGMVQLASTTQPTASDVISKIRPYGWVFAGTFLPTVERMQAAVSNAVTAGLPLTQPPTLDFTGDPHMYDGARKFFFGKSTADDEKDTRKSVSQDLANFSVLTSKTWAQQHATDTECAAMLGLQNAAQGNSPWLLNTVFSTIDRIASVDKVWRYGAGGQPCAKNSAGAGLNTFSVGADLTGTDIFSQMASLGHGNIDVAFTLLEFSMLGKLGSVAAAMLGAATGAVSGSAVVPGAGTSAGAILGAVTAVGLQSLFNAASGVLDFLAIIFMACGFTLAFVLPMFPFTRFFFAVLSWVGAIVEAVIAIPLVALAHLNPEGEGLAGAAKGAYYFIFNIFLRPVLTVFGLIAGLIIFMIAASFLTYTYNAAVAASGGTAYGHEVMSKIIYSVLYVAFMYICANHSFSLITHIPEHALKWMGQSGQAMPSLGDPGKVAEYEGLMGAYAGKQLVDGIKTGGNIIRDRTSGMGQNLIGNKPGSGKPGGSGGDGGPDKGGGAGAGARGRLANRPTRR